MFGTLMDPKNRTNSHEIFFFIKYWKKRSLKDTHCVIKTKWNCQSVDQNESLLKLEIFILSTVEFWLYCCGFCWSCRKDFYFLIWNKKHRWHHKLSRTFLQLTAFKEYQKTIWLNNVIIEGLRKLVLVFAINAEIIRLPSA